MTTSEEDDKRPYSKAKVMIGFSLVVPWLVINIFLKKHDPSLSYSIGLLLGMMTAYLLFQRGQFWVLLTIATALAISHYVFVPQY